MSNLIKSLERLARCMMETTQWGADAHTVLTAAEELRRRSTSPEGGALSKFCDELVAQRGELQREVRLGRALFEAALKWQNDPHALSALDRTIEEYRQYSCLPQKHSDQESK